LIYFSLYDKKRLNYKLRFIGQNTRY